MMPSEALHRMVYRGKRPGPRAWESLSIFPLFLKLHTSQILQAARAPSSVASMIRRGWRASPITK